MKLTPLDIRHKEFRRAVRGYSDEDVDVFLDEVADEFERVFQQNIELQDRLERLEQQVQQYESLRETLQNTLVSAQQQADETKANAHKEAELILKDAELKGRDLVNQSYTDKQRVQQALIQLRQIEEDFRFKFRSLLEAHLSLLTEDEASGERGEFQRLVTQVDRDLGEGGVSAQAKRQAPPAGEREATPSFLREGEFGELDSDTASPAPAAPTGSNPPSEEEDEAVLPLPEAGPEDSAEPEPLEPFDPEKTAEGPADEESGENGTDHRESGVRRFLFGKKEEDEEPEDFFAREESREFEW
ncbi:MAG TPA: DivIVA domain-containing protein [Thermoleophilia bacterium]|nr:DivIVA domain-containing protein [Thermoleophilia bacterium]